MQNEMFSDRHNKRNNVRRDNFLKQVTIRENHLKENCAQYDFNEAVYSWALKS